MTNDNWIAIISVALATPISVGSLCYSILNGKKTEERNKRIDENEERASLEQQRLDALSLIAGVETIALNEKMSWNDVLRDVNALLRAQETDSMKNLRQILSEGINKSEEAINASRNLRANLGKTFPPREQWEAIRATIGDVLAKLVPMANANLAEARSREFLQRANELVEKERIVRQQAKKLIEMGVEPPRIS